jgi:phosphatidylglycerol:prolipoprotein diacylglycerol transferase
VYPAISFPFISFAVPTYGLVLTIYFFVAIALMLYLNERQGIPRDTTLAAFAIGIPVGITGARFLDSLEYSGHYVSFGDLVGRNGSSIYGALLADVAVTAMYVRSRGLSPLRFLDAGAPAMALGEVFSRIGCFLNGCCYGVPWSGAFAVSFPPGSFAYRDQMANGLLSSSAPRSLPVHPVQLYSVALMGVAFAYLLRRYERRQHDGEVFWSFLVIYGMLRLLMAPLRVEALTSMKVFSALFVLVGVVGIAYGYIAPAGARALQPRSGKAA